MLIISNLPFYKLLQQFSIELLLLSEKLHDIILLHACNIKSCVEVKLFNKNKAISPQKVKISIN